MQSGSTGGARPRRLGRGLSSLLETPVPVPLPSANVPHTTIYSHGDTSSPGAPGAGENGIVEIEIASVVPNPNQPRRGMDEAGIQRLADSIRRAGLMQPVIVRPGPVGGARYELVAGERRWRAAAKAGLTRVPALVRALSDEESAEWALVENVQREDLNAMERAWGFRSMAEKFGLTHGQIGERVGIDRSTVANFVRLTELEEPIQEMIIRGHLNSGHGKALLAVPPGQGRVDLALEAVREGWSTRRLERAAAAIQQGKKQGVPAPERDLSKPAAVEDLERRLGEYLGSKVSIVTDRGGKRGRMSIEFYGLDHFDGLMARIGFATQS